MVDDGLLSYPYSTRELVNLVRHLEQFPNDSLVHTIENVFAFDNYDVGLREQVTQAFHRHGIPVGVVRDRFKVPITHVQPPSLPPSLPYFESVSACVCLRPHLKSPNPFLGLGGQ